MAFFRSLYNKYSGAIYSIVLQIVFDGDLAGEILQDAFVRIWRKIDSYDISKGSLFTWMAMIARNLATDMIRSRRIQNSRNTGSMQECYLNNSEMAIYPDVNVIGIRKMLDMLKPQHRVLIDLSYFNGYTSLQIAQMKNMPLESVKTNLRNALNELRTYLIRDDSVVLEGAV